MTDPVLIAQLLASIALSPLSPMRPDTPPPLPIPVERLAELKTQSDLVATARLADGSRAPADLTLPQLTNRSEVLKYMLEHYPLELRDRYDFEMPWAWMFIDEHGRPGQIRIVKGSGRAAFDSLALGALQVSRFAPALVRGKATGVWVPMPIEIAYKHLADRAPRERATPGEPHFTPYTIKPALRDRQEVSRALVKHYPPELRAAGVGGTSLLWVFVDEEGRTAKAQLKASSGNELLDNAALVVARGISWTPARNRGETVAVWIQIPIVFQPNPVVK